MLTLIRPQQSVADQDADALQIVDRVGGWLAEVLADAAQRRDVPTLRRHARDQALVLMLFWRRVSAAELTGVRIENLTFDARLGMGCKVQGRHGPRAVNWAPVTRPSLRHLCPLRAVRLWLDVAGIDRGPLFPRIERDGALAREALSADSVYPLLLELVEQSEGPVGQDTANAGYVVPATAPHSEQRARVPARPHGADARIVALRPTRGPRPAGETPGSCGEQLWTR